MSSLEERLKEKRVPVIVSYGGGTDSTAVLLACKERGVPVDAILFSDTGGEKPHTYAFIETMSNWLVANGMPAITILKRTTRAKVEETLEQECLRQTKLPSIAYGFKTCSQKYKVEPQQKFLNNWEMTKQCWKNGDKPIVLIGYNADEARRATKADASAAKNNKRDKYQYHYPLIEWGITRARCQELIEKAGLPKPGKSACFFCPNSKKQEILELQTQYPDLLQRAIGMEDNARAQFTKIKGLGRRFSWKDFVAQEKEACEIAWFSDIDLPCGCYDGD